MTQIRLHRAWLDFTFQPAVRYSLSLDGRSIGHCWKAESFLARLRGIKAFDRLESDESLLFERSSCVHGYGMQRALDLVFVDREWQILKVTSLGINRVEKCKGAHAVFELEQGNAVQLGLKEGCRLIPGDAQSSHDLQDGLVRQEGG
ncbi:DUF192 domain-containing protein [Granulosicoccus antarcticus]|uniref:DUF192 domain-containing protein n=1 Tax=Granulosicoccus antarcticus IMCC3135 TaxID=1192854 RepID=A0A2Z2NPU4_9GAMM|nr:DUF192 domain-containing protein [Granulosicoccus antarcticus]ASJ71951.1 hypothetical protein IMCC3135_09270 [Granulosicoccus antarcticus IMCC3135]